MNSEHTAEHFRDEELLSPFFDCIPWGVEDSLGRERFEKRAATKARALLAEERPPVLTPDQEAAIDEIVAEAARDLKPSIRYLTQLRHDSQSCPVPSAGSGTW